MSLFFQRITCFVLICSLQNASLCKENSKFYSKIGHNYDNKDISHNLDYRKDLVISMPNDTNVKKHKIERVTRRQYEIVNVLWRKTKIFLDIDNTATPKEVSVIKDQLTTNPRQSNKCKIYIPVSTPSSIEFYYSDKLEEKIQSKDSLLSKGKKEITDVKIKENFQNKFIDSKTKVLRRPIFTFHLNNRNLKETDVDSENFYLELNEHINNIQSNKSNQSQVLINIPEKLSNKRIARNNNNDSQWLSIFFNDPLDRVIAPNKEEISLKSSTFYDRIKFFEIYDNNTLATTEPHSKGEIQSQSDVTFPHDFKNTTQLLKPRNDYSIQRYAPKSLYNSKSFLRTPRTIVNKKRNIINNLGETYETHSSQVKRSNEITRNSLLRTGTSIVWSKYPFLSVYIYEPMSIYCDAAAINSYWLIAAGSCLSRHHKSNVAIGRSAFISYCGDKWWELHAIAYVRRTLVHPLYNRRDKVRRHHYNIGAVQVITSMINSCRGWAPISLVSHNFTINEKGFPATAIGWGLDRYNSRSSYFNIPRHPLVAYEGTIFPKSCPRGSKSSDTLYEELNIKNLYCLSLPYKGEKKDTVHGNLLLVQGKLIALALQKGKIQGSETSALYTGVWRLVPWILDLTHNTTKELRNPKSTQ